MHEEQFALVFISMHAFKNDYIIGLLGNLGRMYGLLTSEACFFRVLHNTEYSWSCAQTVPLNKNASALVVAESEKG